MNPDSFILNGRNIHSTDSNSLLRLYDLANRIARQSPVQLEREMADKAIGRNHQRAAEKKCSAVNGTADMPGRENGFQTTLHSNRKAG
jgi:hypothetical protein